jgi:hypothetical protein
MQTILIAVKRPIPPTREEQMQGVQRPDWLNYREFVNRFDSNTGPSQGIEQIGEGSWLIQQENGASFLAKVIQQAEYCHVSYILMFIEESTVWRQESKQSQQIV